MTKKQIAAGVGAVLIAVAGVLMECKDEAPIAPAAGAPPVLPPVDAGR